MPTVTLRHSDSRPPKHSMHSRSLMISCVPSHTGPNEKYPEEFRNHLSPQSSSAVRRQCSLTKNTIARGRSELHVTHIPHQTRHLRSLRRLSDKIEVVQERRRLRRASIRTSLPSILLLALWYSLHLHLRLWM